MRTLVAALLVVFTMVANAEVPVATSVTPNNFPALPVRQHEKVFVWFTRAQDAASYDQVRAKFEGTAVGRELKDYQERTTQVLRLAPTSRSLLR